MLLSFSRAVVAVPDAAGSAVCTNAQRCADVYRLLGASSLGAVQSAEVQPIPRENEVLLTHAAAQRGGNYTLIAANGVTGDGFDDAGAIRSASAESLGRTPLDRATFGGLGLPIVHFGDGPLAADPFGDGSEFSFVFRYGEKVYLGPNRSGQRSVRMNADGSQVEDMTWRLGKDVNNGIGTHSLNNASAPFPGVGHAGCQNNSYECGPDNENGRGLFTSGQLAGARVAGARRWPERRRAGLHLHGARSRHDAPAQVRGSRAARSAAPPRASAPWASTAAAPTWASRTPAARASPSW